VNYYVKIRDHDVAVFVNWARARSTSGAKQSAGWFKKSWRHSLMSFKITTI